MAQRVGLRLNPTSGTCEIILPMDESEYARGFRIIKDGDQTHFMFADIADAGGGTYNVYDVNFNPVFGLRKIVSAGTPWTIWFNPPEAGVYTDLFSGAYTKDTEDDVRARVIVETDGVEDVIYNQTSFNFDEGGDYTSTSWTGAMTMTIAESVAFSNFWTDFNKTQENAPS